MLLRLLFVLCLIGSSNVYAQEDEDVANFDTASNKQEQTCETKLKELEASTDNESYRLTRYKDLYAIFGSPNTKIQISFKYKLTSLLNLYIGYTQLMFWELGHESSPFRDINFNPDFFYRMNFPKHNFVKAIDFIVFEHKSNGKDGAASRAWNGSGIKLYTIVKFYSWSFNWDTKISWYYNLGMDDTNWDYREYAGFWDTRISFINYYDPDEFIDRVSLYFAFFPGGKYSQSLAKGGQELGIKFRLGWGMFYPSLFFQFYHGYNESLLDYNKDHYSYRLGIAF